MDFSQIFSELKRRRLWVAVGIAVAGLAALSAIASLSLFPPAIRGKPVGHSTATIQMLVDGERSPLLNTKSDIGVLNEQASIVSNLLASQAVIDSVGRAARIPGDAIAVDPPIANNLQRSQQEPTAEKRANQILDERKVFRIEIDESSQLPAISAIAQAPSAEEATDLANAVPRGITNYLNDVESAAGTPEAERVTIRALAPALGTPVGSAAKIEVAGIVFTVTLLLWCALVVVASKLSDVVRSVRAEGGPADPATPPAISSLH